MGNVIELRFAGSIYLYLRLPVQPEISIRCCIQKNSLRGTGPAHTKLIHQIKCIEPTALYPFLFLFQRIEIRS